MHPIQISKKKLREFSLIKLPGNIGILRSFCSKLREEEFSWLEKKRLIGSHAAIIPR